jgi:uncharacterized protein with GYD domain
VTFWPEILRDARLVPVLSGRGGSRIWWDPTLFKEGSMAKYLLEVNYTLDGIKGVKAKGGSGRVAAATELIEGLGGKMESFHFAFGGTDVYVIADFPDNVSAAAAALTVGAGGGATARTVVLLTAAEIDSAIVKETTYRPPGR